MTASFPLTPMRMSSDTYEDVIDDRCREQVGRLCKADSATHTVSTGYLGPKMKAGTEATLNGSWDTTDISVAYHSTPVFTGSWETDIIFQYDDGLPAGTWGRTICDDDSPGNWKCDQFYVYYHGDKICPPGGGTYCNDATMHRALACHEVAHTLGFTHGVHSDPAGTSNNQFDFRCIRVPLPTGDPWVGSANVGHVNQEY